MKVGDVVILKSQTDTMCPRRMTVERILDGGLISCIYFLDGVLRRAEIPEGCLEINSEAGRAAYSNVDRPAGRP